MLLELHYVVDCCHLEKVSSHDAMPGSGGFVLVEIGWHLDSNKSKTP